jgi:microcystin-dependent protein
MADAITPYAGLTKPTVGADDNAWGGLLNADLDILDQFLRNIVPAGVSFDYRGPVTGGPPPGFLFEDGSAVSRSTYATLYGVIGVTYGAGDGVSTFNLPDSRGRFSVGAGGVFPLAQVGGSLTYTGATDAHALTAAEGPSHGHGLSDPSHNHTLHDGGHGHGVNDPTHTHGVNDPQHQHSITGAGDAPNQQLVFYEAGAAYFSSGSNNFGGAHPGVASPVATGISIAAGPSYITIQGSGANISLDGAFTGQAVQASGGGSPHTHTLTAIPTTPPYLAANRIIKT